MRWLQRLVWTRVIYSLDAASAARRAARARGLMPLIAFERADAAARRQWLGRFSASRTYLLQMSTLAILVAALLRLVCGGMQRFARPHSLVQAVTRWLLPRRQLHNREAGLPPCSRFCA